MYVLTLLLIRHISSCSSSSRDKQSPCAVTITFPQNLKAWLWGFVHSATRVLEWSGTDVESEDLWCSQCSSSSWRCSVGLRSGLCAGHVSSLTPTLVNHVFTESALCTGTSSCWVLIKTFYTTVFFQLCGKNHIWIWLSGFLKNFGHIV